MPTAWPWGNLHLLSSPSKPNPVDITMYSIHCILLHFFVRLLIHLILQSIARLFVHPSVRSFVRVFRFFFFYQTRFRPMGVRRFCDYDRDDRDDDDDDGDGYYNSPLETGCTKESREFGQFFFLFPFRLIFRLSSLRCQCCRYHRRHRCHRRHPRHFHWLYHRHSRFKSKDKWFPLFLSYPCFFLSR